MLVSDETLVVVQRSWRDWRTALVRLADLHDIHWQQPDGAPKALAHAYVSCADILAGQLAHDCEGPSVPHRLLVCIVKSHTLPPAYERIAQQADDAAVPFPRAAGYIAMPAHPH